MPGIRDEIRSQPDVIRKTIRSVSTGLDALAPYAAELKNGRPVIITGMGGSHSAGMLLQYGLIERNIPAFVIESSELLYHQRPLLANNPLIVMISQSGESREVVRLLAELTTRKIDCAVIGITNTPNSTLATHRNVHHERRQREQSALASRRRDHRNALPDRSWRDSPPLDARTRIRYSRPHSTQLRL